MSHLDRHSQSMNLQWSLVSFGLPHRSTCVLLFTTSNLDHVFWFTTSKLVHILEFGFKSVTKICTIYQLVHGLLHVFYATLSKNQKYAHSLI